MNNTSQLKKKPNYKLKYWIKKPECWWRTLNVDDERPNVDNKRPIEVGNGDIFASSSRPTIISCQSLTLR